MLLRLLILVGALLFAQAASAWNTPMDAIQHFLKFELDGGRLKSWTFGKYLAVRDGEYDEPGWDVVALIESYKIQNLSCSGESCTARVSFQFVPTKTLTFKDIFSHPDGGTEIVEYKIVQSNSQWLLEPSDASPKVYLSTYKRLGRK